MRYKILKPIMASRNILEPGSWLSKAIEKKIEKEIPQLIKNGFLAEIEEPPKEPEPEKKK